MSYGIFEYSSFIFLLNIWNNILDIGITYWTLVARGGALPVAAAAAVAS